MLIIYKVVKIMHIFGIFFYIVALMFIKSAMLKNRKMLKFLINFFLRSSLESHKQSVKVCKRMKRSWLVADNDYIRL